MDAGAPVLAGAGRRCGVAEGTAENGDSPVYSRETVRRRGAGAGFLRARREAAGLTQVEAVKQLNLALAPSGRHISERWFRALESLHRSWPQPVAAAYAELIGLRGPLLAKFYATVGCSPGAGLGAGGITEADRHHLHHTLRETPSYLSDEFWDVQLMNAALRAMVPSLSPGMNIMHFVLASRTGRRIFTDYEGWAVPMLHQLRTAFLAAQEPGYRAGLEKLIENVLQDPDVARLWESEQSIDVSPNGEVRWIRPADPAAPDGLGEPIPLRLYVTAPIGHPFGWRFMSVTPLDEFELERTKYGYADEVAVA